MTLAGLIQILIFALVLLAAARPLGGYLHRIHAGGPAPLDRLFLPAERAMYRLAGIDEAEDQHWAAYAFGFLLFHLAGFLLLYGLLRLQGLLPLNPQGFAAVAPDLAFNTAISFVTNTNWQAYAGESTLGHLAQMAGLAVQNFLSAAAGIVVAVALIRGFSRRQAAGIGNVWVDLTRTTTRLLLPACLVYALFLVWQGVPQTLAGSAAVTTLEGAAQTLPLGPVASQEAIKLLGTNGGGFFNANSAHPFENPTPLSNLVQMLSIFLIPVGLTNLLGRMIGDERQGWALLGAMALLFGVGLGLAYGAEAAASGLEGKETRFGIAGSVLFANVTTAASCGAVNAMHDSLTPLAGLVTLVNILLGEVVFGGVGSGLYGMLLFAIVAVFVAGLMVGRSPEYLGKKIEAREIKLTMLALLAPSLTILGLAALAVLYPPARAAVQDPGPHGLTEILYAAASASGNNGSAFAGLGANIPFYNLGLSVNMVVGRFFVIVPVLAIAGALAAKRPLAPTAGTFPTHGTQFVGLLAAIVVIVGGLTFLPALALGPIAEHLALAAGRLF